MAAAAQRKDPLRNFKFKVEFEAARGAAKASFGFSKVSGLKESSEIIEYREGGQKEGTAMKMPGQTSYDNIVLERGKPANVSGDAYFRTWRNLIAKAGEAGVADPTQRRTMTIQLLDRNNTPIRTYKCVNCWPSEIEIADLEGDGNDVLIESVTICHEGFTEL